MLTFQQGRLRRDVHLDRCLHRHVVERCHGKPSKLAPCTSPYPLTNTQSKRLYHVVTTLIPTFAALSYFAMATGSGKGLHHIRETESHDTVPDTHRDIYREVYWARYVDWSVTTPLLLLDLMLLAGANGGSIFIAIVADLIMILTGLFAAYAKSEGEKWGWYTMACVAYLAIVWQLVVNGRATAQARGGKVGNFFVAIGGYTLLLWTIYPM